MSSEFSLTTKRTVSPPCAKVAIFDDDFALELLYLTKVPNITQHACKSSGK